MAPGRAGGENEPGSGVIRSCLRCHRRLNRMTAGTMPRSVPGFTWREKAMTWRSNPIGPRDKSSVAPPRARRRSRSSHASVATTTQRSSRRVRVGRFLPLSFIRLRILLSEALRLQVHSRVDIKANAQEHSPIVLMHARRALRLSSAQECLRGRFGSFSHAAHHYRACASTLRRPGDRARWLGLLCNGPNRCALEFNR